MAATPEGKIKSQLKKGLQRLKDQGHKLFVRMPVSRGMGLPWLDFVIGVKGHYVIIETKRDAKTPLTFQQELTKQEANHAGVPVLVVYDGETVNRALTIIEALSRGLPVSWLTNDVTSSLDK